MIAKSETIWIVWTVRLCGVAGWKPYLNESAARRAAHLYCALGYTIELRKHVRGSLDHHIEVLIPAACPEQKT